MAQGSLFDENNIDRKATIHAVEKALKEYKEQLLIAPEKILPKVTDKCTIELDINDFDQNYNLIMDVHRAINRLSLLERSIIIKKYMLTDELYDYEIYNSLGVSERSFYRIKEAALFKLSFPLRKQVYINREGVS